jgi:hypothetical protein
MVVGVGSALGTRTAKAPRLARAGLSVDIAGRN